MKIVIGDNYKNKTWRYLVPTLRDYGDEFIGRLNKVFKLASGIHDTLLDASELSKGRNIYLMIDIKYQPDNYKEFEAFIKHESFYVTDYCPDADITKSRKRVFVIKVPKRFHNAYDMFLQGRYSEMFEDEDVEKLFGSPAKEREYKIIKKSPDMVVEFADSVNSYFKSNVLSYNFMQGELELPLIKSEEIFNNYAHGERVFFNEKLDKVWAQKI